MCAVETTTIARHDAAVEIAGRTVGPAGGSGIDDSLYGRNRGRTVSRFHPAVIS
jgi:hypothetical protein